MRSIEMFPEEPDCIAAWSTPLDHYCIQIISYLLDDGKFHNMVIKLTDPVHILAVARNHDNYKILIWC